MVEADGSMQMFWIDAHEDCCTPGRIYMFGKVRSGEGGFSSCCVQIDNVQRQVFVLPRERLLDGGGTETGERVDVMEHVLPEFGHAARGRGILAHKCKVVRRSYMYHFLDSGIPEEGEYVKCVYPAQYAGFPSNVGGRSFSRVLGGSQSLLEGFLLKRGLMGPCWVRVHAAAVVSAQASWCQCEVQVSDPKSVRVEVGAREAPPVSIMSLHLQTITNEDVNEVVVVSAVCHDSVHVDGLTENEKGGYTGFTGVCRPAAGAWPGELRRDVEGWNEEHEKTPRSMHATERALLSWFTAKVQAVDPDVLVGHNCLAGDLDVLLSRMQALKIEGRSKLGRLRRAVNRRMQRVALAGRLVCDTQVAAKEHLKETTYDLSELSRTQLGETREEVDVRDVSGYFRESRGVMSLLSLNERDARLTVALMLKLVVLPLSKQLANLAGNLWSRSLLGARAERVEYLLLHEFHRLKYILPEKVVGSGKRQREHEAEANTKKGGLSGGLVLEPKRGLYAEPVLVLDFKSLYPSIIQEYNICFTTVRAVAVAGEQALYELPGRESKAGVLPSVMKTLVERRRQVQTLMQQEVAEDRKRQYEIRQRALKVMANSMYGCLGCKYSRFYAEPLAEMVTSQGRVILQQAVDLTQNKCGLEVVYGDTDSIFVKSGCESVADAQRVAREVQRTLNRTWKLLEVGLEGVYCPLLLVNKKKYAALAVTERDGAITKVQVCKGLDCVRRDCCALAKRTADEVLQFVLSGEPAAAVVSRIHAFLRELRCDVDNDRVPVSEFVITKCMGKSPSDYTDADVQAHVQVALKLQALGRVVRAGEHVAYVITAKEGTKNFAQRAEDPRTVETSGGRMTLDKKWYMQAQVHAAVSRICAVVQGTDSGQLGECLGLQVGRCAQGPAAEPKCDSVERLHGMCSDGVCREFLGAYVVDATGVRSGLRVSSVRTTDGVVFNPRAMRLQLHQLFRKCMARYTDGWLVCTEEMCQQRTRNVMCDAECGLRCAVAGCTGQLRVEYTSRQLYEQLLYMQMLFDFGEAARKLAAANAGRVKQGVLPLRAPKMEQGDISAIEVLHADCQRILRESAYGQVDLARLCL